MLATTTMLALSYSPSAMLRPPVCSRSAGIAQSPRYAAAVTMQFDFSKVSGSVMEKMGMKPAESGLSEEETQNMEERLRSGSMTFDDFMMQMDVMQKGASVQAMIGKLGGGGAQAEEMEAGRKKLLSYKQYVEVMDAEERAEPKLLIDELDGARGGGSAPRLERIAEATQKSVEDVGRFVMEFNMMRGAAVKFANGESPDSIRESMMAEQQASGVAPKMNRQQRRMAAKKTKKKKASAGGFGR